ncbi:MAG: glycosyltransferase family 39 protein [Bacteroidota bacterium]
MVNDPLKRENKGGGYTLLIGFALFKLVIHLITNTWGGYGYFRDELYYLACSDHLAAGYVDEPPLSIFILYANRALLGDSIFMLRLLPAILGAITVFTVGLITRELGGKRFAQSIACIASIASLGNLAMNTYYSMNAFEIFFWVWTAYLVIRLINTGDWVYWVFIGCILGLGMLNKISVLWLAFGIYAGILLTPQRHWFKTMYPYIAGVIALAIFSPFIIWNMLHDFAHLEFIRNATNIKYQSVTEADFIEGQILVQNPLTLPLWLAGIGFFFFIKEGKKFIAIGWIYVATLLILLGNFHSKPEYLSPAYGMLFAGGGIAFERMLTLRTVSWIKPLYAAILVVGGLVLAPVTLPILPVETFIHYSDVLGISPTTSEAHELDKLPQFYADMFGWEDKAAAVAEVYHTLTPDEQSRCAIYADNYGRCGAIDLFGKKYGLPPSIGSHNNYWLWGPRDYTGELVIILGGELRDKQDKFQSVTIARIVKSEYCLPYENNLNIYVCRGLKVPLRELWPTLKTYI